MKIDIGEIKGLKPQEPDQKRIHLRGLYAYALIECAVMRGIDLEFKDFYVRIDKEENNCAYVSCNISSVYKDQFNMSEGELALIIRDKMMQIAAATGFNMELA